ncbi:MAG: CaiB/BaiF CoA transferase family protein [Pigmentiphaga sp.]
MSTSTAGPLSGLRVIELAGLGPAPMCAMLLADLGASVLRVERAQGTDLGVSLPRSHHVHLRSRPAITLDLKDSQDRAWLLGAVANVDILLEGFRPGVVERLGLGPADCHALNPRLIYGRMTGWGQDGPLAQHAGHDINYIAVSGALATMGRSGQPPAVPLNLIADYGGGALYLALGLLAAYIERERSGLGQVVDAAMVDGTASLLGMICGLLGAGHWVEQRGQNILDSGAYFYDVYECADHQWVAIGAIERQFHDKLLRALGFDESDLSAREDRSRWSDMRERLAAIFKTRPRAEWEAELQPMDVCFSPVLSLSEAWRHPQLGGRGSYVDVQGIMQPAPAPRFSRTPPPPLKPIDDPNIGYEDLLAQWGLRSPHMN